MDLNVSNVGFKANMVTQLKGRHDIMTKVGQRFAEKTKHMKGELVINRAAKEIVSDAHALEFDVNGASYIISEGIEDFLGNNIKSKKELTDGVVDRIATTFVNVFKALTAESKFEIKTANLQENIEETKKALLKNLSYATACEKRGNKASEMYKALAKQNRNRLNSLKSQYAKECDAFLSRANKIGAEDSHLDVWHVMMNETYGE